MQTTTATQPTSIPLPRRERAALLTIRPKNHAPGRRAVLATAALVLLIAAAFAGAWRLAGPFDSGGGGDASDRAARQPGIAAPDAPADCPLTHDIPVLDAGGMPPFPEWAALSLENSELWLRCGDREATLIEENVAEAIPLAWPGTMLVITEDDTLRGVNLVTGARGDFGSEAVLYGPAGDGSGGNIAAPLPYAGGPANRWMALPATPDQTDWRFVDLETMESRLLSDLIGGLLPDSTVAIPFASSDDGAVIGFPGTPAFGEPPPSNPLDRGGATPSSGTPVGELPSETAALVIDGSLENTRWTETAPYPSFQPAAIGPEGELLAIEHMTADGSLTVRVEHLDSGEFVVETGIAYGSGDSMVLLADGTGLLHLTATRLDRVTWDAPGTVTTETLIEFAAPQEVPVLARGTSPGITVVGATDGSGGPIGYLVDTAAGKVTEVPGMLHIPFIMVGYDTGEPVSHVLAAAPSGTDGQHSTIRLVEVATGEVAAESEPLDLPPSMAATLDAALRDHGTIGFVFLQDGTTIALDAETGEARAIPPPEGVSGREWFLQPSPHGDWLVANRSGDAYLLDLASGAWREVPPGTGGKFVPGIGNDAVD